MIGNMAGSDLQRAAELLAAGDWQAAHAIVQDDGSAGAAWLHGIVHTLEGDLDNARYWYRQAGRGFRGPRAGQGGIAEGRGGEAGGEPNHRFGHPLFFWVGAR